MERISRERLYLSTLAPDAAELARSRGLGVELAEYCTAYNMDREFAGTDAVVQAELRGNPRPIQHAPFN